MLEVKNKETAALLVEVQGEKQKADVQKAQVLQPEAQVRLVAAAKARTAALALGAPPPATALGWVAMVWVGAGSVIFGVGTGLARGRRAGAFACVFSTFSFTSSILLSALWFSAI